MGKGASKHATTQKPEEQVKPEEPPPINHFVRLQEANALNLIMNALRENLKDLLCFTHCCKAMFQAIAVDHILWRDMYLLHEPLACKDLSKRICKESYCDQNELVGNGKLQRSVWMRTCKRLFKKPKLVLVLSGRDPIIVRKLGQPESEAEHVFLGINYHLDSYLDDDEEQFAVEFPQIFQDLEEGDLVITQDYRGAGCFTAFTDPDDHFLLKLKKNQYDEAGFGILSKAVAPPSYPLFYYCDVKFGDHIDRRTLMKKEVYWFTFSQLKDGGMYSWVELDYFEDE